MSRIHVVVGALAITGASALAQAPRLPDRVRSAADGIAARNLAADLEYLSSDALRGRDTFSPGLDSARQFIIRRLTRAGLEPLGDSGTFLQRYVVREIEADTAATWIEIDGRRFAHGDVLLQLFGGPTSVTAPVVYVGHGFRIPFLNVDPYAGVDIRGKIVLAHIGGPPPGVDPSSLASRESEVEFVTQVALQRGAAGVLAIPSRGMLGRWEQLRRSPTGRTYRELEPNVASWWQALRLTSVFLGPSASRELLAGDSALARELEARTPNAPFPPSRDLGRRVTINAPAGPERRLSDANVVALIEGSDPRLRSEYVTIGAHLDGAVELTAINGDSIYNAADDNASGSVGILAIAEQMMLAPRPRRSILFFWDSGEEVGLFGSRAFVGKPVVPPKDIVAHFNIDMIGATRAPGRADSAAADAAEAGEVFVAGPRVLSTELDSLIERVNRAYLNMRLNHKHDTVSSEFFYPRTDAAPFLERGVPSIDFFTGLHERYHGPADEARYLDPVKMESIARTVFAVAWSIADSLDRPSVDKGIPASVRRYP